MFEIIFVVIYVISVIISYREIRNWHLKHGLKPQMFDVCITLVPIVNLACAFASIVQDIPTKRTFAEWFFRINDGGGDDD